MAKWCDVMDVGSLEPGDSKCLEVDGVPLVVAKVDDEVHVFENNCPHAGMPLGEGELTGKVITCPFHGFAYNIASGKNVDDPNDIPMQVYPCRVEGQMIQVELE